MGPAISGFARGGEAASRDVAVHRGHTHYVWRSDGVYESAGLFVRDCRFPPFLFGIGAEPFLTTRRDTLGTSRATQSQAIDLPITRFLSSSTASSSRLVSKRMTRQATGCPNHAYSTHQGHTYCKPRCGFKTVQRWKR